jgi:hypothetical protein
VIGLIKDIALHINNHAHGSAAVQEVSAQRKPMKQKEGSEALAGL